MVKKYERKTPKKGFKADERKILPDGSPNPVTHGAPEGSWGQPKHEVTEENKRIIKALVAYGVPYAEVATQLQISVDTLSRHYKLELETAKAEAVAKMGEGVYRRGIDGSIQDAHFYLKTQGYKYGWSERTQIEHTGKDGGAIKNETVLLPATDELLKRFARDGEDTSP